ncbi:MAG: zinc ABC transporter substrate-binding protein [Verrucomicrobiota bacterium]|nr:zinc ABC transporter substrate-binding protein [Verrucomicrobiota bacterium]
MSQMSFIGNYTISVVCALMVACAPAGHQPSGGDGKIKVTTTTTMITDLVKQIGGDLVEVEGLMGPGVDPHLFTPKDKDIDLLKEADVIFYHGLFLEGRMQDMFVDFASDKKHVYRVTKGIPKKLLLMPDDFDGHPDPHVWFDVELWAKCVDEVVKGLSEVDPVNKGAYEESGKQYSAKLATLREWSVQRIDELPKEKRILFTSHDAFNYFANSHEFRVEALLGISTNDEAGSSDVTAMVDKLNASSVKVLFTESSVSSKGLEQIKKDAGATIGGELFSDAMGEPGKMEGPEGDQYDVGTYEGMIRHNINTIVDALK